MDSTRVLAQRLATQRLSSTPLPRAADAVRLLTAVQCQERDQAFYSLGLRTRRTTLTTVQGELDNGAFIRTHILRPTWHFVAPEDLRWMLALTSPRVERGMGARHRQLGLDDSRVVGAGLDLLAELLRGKTFRTRRELGEEFAARGSQIHAGEQLGHLLLIAELRGLICSGPTKGVHHSYALIDEVVKPTPELSAEAAHIELVRRFFAGHGPASVKDFTRWSSLTSAGTRAALAEIGDGLAQVDVDGTALWFDPAVVPRRSPAAPATYLFPTYDEAVLTYPSLNFPLAAGNPQAEQSDPFWAWIVQRGVAVGCWKRRVTPSTVDVEVLLAPGLTKQALDDVRGAAARMARFLERELVFVEAATGATDSIQSS